MIFEQMRRKDRALGAAEIDRILREGEYGILSLTGRNGYPHPIPMSYAYVSGVIWMHASAQGSKMEDLRAEPRASFCVVGPTQVLPEDFTTRYESVIAYGVIRSVSGEGVMEGLRALVAKYAPDLRAEGDTYAARYLQQTAVLCFEVHHVTGKANRAGQ